MIEVKLYPQEAILMVTMETQLTSKSSKLTKNKRIIDAYKQFVNQLRPTKFPEYDMYIKGMKFRVTNEMKTEETEHLIHYIKWVIEEWKERFDV